MLKRQFLDNDYLAKVAREVQRLDQAGIDLDLDAGDIDALLHPPASAGLSCRRQKFVRRGALVPHETHKGNPTSSHYFGVTFNRTVGKYQAQINRRRHRWYGGMFATESLAADAVQKELKRHLNQF